MSADCTAAARLFTGGDTAINSVSCCQGQHLAAIDLACNPDGRITRLALDPASLPANVAFRAAEALAPTSPLGQLSQLQVLRLPNAGLAGAFPAAALAPLSQLTYLDLSGNTLSGTLPESLASTLPKLDALNLNGNQLSGSLAPLRNAPLTSLQVAGNSFTGPLPAIASLTSCVGLAATLCRPAEGPSSPCAASLPACPQPSTTTVATTSSSATTTTTTLTTAAPSSTLTLNASPSASVAPSTSDPDNATASPLKLWLGIAGGILGAILVAFLLLLFLARRRRRRLAHEKIAASTNRSLGSANSLERGAHPAHPPPLAAYSKVATHPNALDRDPNANDGDDDDGTHEQDLGLLAADSRALRHVDSADHLLITSPNSPHAMVVEPPRVPGHGGDTHSLLTTNTRSGVATGAAWSRTLRQGSFSDGAAATPPVPTLRGKPSRMSLASGSGLGSALSPPLRATPHGHAYPVPGPLVDVTATDVYDMFFGLPRVPGCTTQQLHPRTPSAEHLPATAGGARQSHMWRTTMVSESSGSGSGDDADEWATVAHAWDSILDALQARITRFMTSPTSAAAAHIAGDTAWSLLLADVDLNSATASGFLGTNPDLPPPPSPTLGATSTGRAARTAAVMHFASIELVKFLAGVQSTGAVAACAHRVYGVGPTTAPSVLGGGPAQAAGEVSATDVPRVFAALARLACGAVHARLVPVAALDGVDEAVVGATEDAEADDAGVATAVNTCVRQFVTEVRALAAEYEGNLALKLNVLGCTPAGSGAGTPTRTGSPFMDATPMSPGGTSAASALGLTEVFLLAAVHWARIKALRPGLGLVIVPPSTHLQPAWMDDSANQNASARPFVQVLGTCFPALVEAVPDLHGGQGWSWRAIKPARVWMREDGPRKALD